MDVLEKIEKGESGFDPSESDSNEEITLIYLFAVLLRYRKMIVLGTLVFVVAASLYFVGLPAFRLSRAEARVGNPSPEEIAAAVSAESPTLPLSEYSFLLSKGTYDLSYIVNVNEIPPFLKSLIDNNYGTNYTNYTNAPNYTNLSRYYNAVFGNLSILVPIYKKYNLWPPKADPETDAEMTAFVAELRNGVAENTDTVFAVNERVLGSSLSQDALSARINFLKLPDYAFTPYEAQGAMQPPLTVQFARDAVEEANRRAEEAILPFMQSIVQSAGNNPFITPAMVSAAENFLLGHIRFFELYEMPTAKPTPPEEGERSPLFMVIFAAFVGLFMFAVLAFLRNSVSRLRQDKLSMQVLKDAWRGGKRI